MFKIFDLIIRISFYALPSPCNFYARVILWESVSKGLYGGYDRKKAKRDHSYGCKLGKYLLSTILLLSGDIASNPGPFSTEKAIWKILPVLVASSCYIKIYVDLFPINTISKSFCQDRVVIRFM